MGRASSPGSETTVGRRSRSTVYVRRRALGAIIVLAVSVGVAIPAATALGSSRERLIGRDLIQPPIGVRAFPSPMSSFHHYTTDLKDRTLLTIPDLPENQRMRTAAMDVYGGTTFGISRKRDGGHMGYIPIHATIPSHTQSISIVTLTTAGLSGLWIPVLGTPSQIAFTGGQAARQKKGLHVDTWVSAALATGPVDSMSHNVTTDFVALVHDKGLANLVAVSVALEDKNVPDGLADRAAELTQSASTSLAAARAIEHYLSTNGCYLDENTRFSWPGMRSDRLERMLTSNESLVGDDQQYTALVALVLHQLGTNAYVVMGACPEDGSQGGVTTLRGPDIHAWVEAGFPGSIWDIFDPTPPRDRVPQTQVPKFRSVPRPQVLQPPEPPEPPAGMPPSIRDQSADPLKPPEAGLPWGLIAVGSDTVILLTMPPPTILVFKAGRRRRRCRASPGEALVDSWDEVVGLAADYGLHIDLGHTCQKTAWALSSGWELGQDPGNPSALVTDEVNLGEDGATSSSDSVGVADKRCYVINGWSCFGNGIPVPIVIARFADVANFASNGFSRDNAHAAWAQVRDLRDQVSKRVGFLARIRQAFSLRSLRMCRELRGDTPLVGRMMREENDQ